LPVAAHHRFRASPRGVIEEMSSVRRGGAFIEWLEGKTLPASPPLAAWNRCILPAGVFLPDQPRMERKRRSEPGFS